MSFDIWNRYYTGSKLKLVDWIDELIEEKCEGNSFCDLFAGTGIVTFKELNRFDHVIINDFLFSNNTIYHAFFQQEDYDMEKLQNFINNSTEKPIEEIEDNFLSINYGGKYFSHNDSKRIGDIRNYIEKNKDLFSHKEYCILIASLIYSADKVSNTVGHYDAYKKRKELEDKFIFKFIKPYTFKDKKIEIYRTDSNELAKQIKCDVVYIDPTYNSRQYSRFYHVLETITKWDNPKLSGVALKPPEENMSEYCKISAKKVFDDLISTLQCKYIIVSYNNTYDSKSKSSKNKIQYEEIINSLQNIGELEVYSKKHKFFNAGKTDFKDHKEFLFITKVTN